MDPLRELVRVPGELDDWLEVQDNQPTAFPTELPESEHVMLVVAVATGPVLRAFLIETTEHLELAINPYSFCEARRLFYTVRRSSLELVLEKE